MTRPTSNAPSVETTFGPLGALARTLPGYKDRPQQIELAREILDTFQTDTHLIAEAPTGVGKSLAALVPAFEMIAKNDARVLVVTSSILLQGQYMGYIRNLKPRDKARVKELRNSKGIRPAIAMARKLATA